MSGWVGHDWDGQVLFRPSELREGKRVDEEKRGRNAEGRQIETREGRRR